MSKLSFSKEFLLEVEDKEYKGTLRDLTKKERKTFETKTKENQDKAKELQKLLKRVKKQNRKIEIAEKQEKWEQIEALELELDSLEDKTEKLAEDLESKNVSEDIFKKRIEISVDSADKETILKLGDEYGYQNVFETILKSTQEIQEGN